MSSQTLIDEQILNIASEASSDPGIDADDEALLIPNDDDDDYRYAVSRNIRTIVYPKTTVVHKGDQDLRVRPTQQHETHMPTDATRLFADWMYGIDHSLASTMIGVVTPEVLRKKITNTLCDNIKPILVNYDQVQEDLLMDEPMTLVDFAAKHADNFDFSSMLRSITEIELTSPAQQAMVRNFESHMHWNMEHGFEEFQAPNDNYIAQRRQFANGEIRNPPGLLEPRILSKPIVQNYKNYERCREFLRKLRDEQIQAHNRAASYQSSHTHNGLAYLRRRIETTIATELDKLGLKFIDVCGANRLARFNNRLCNCHPTYVATDVGKDNHCRLQVQNCPHYPDANVLLYTDVVVHQELLLPKDHIVIDTRTAYVENRECASRVTHSGAKHMTVLGGGEYIEHGWDFETPNETFTSGNFIFSRHVVISHANILVCYIRFLGSTTSHRAEFEKYQATIRSKESATGRMGRSCIERASSAACNLITCGQVDKTRCCAGTRLCLRTCDPESFRIRGHPLESGLPMYSRNRDNPSLINVHFLVQYPKPIKRISPFYRAFSTKGPYSVYRGSGTYIIVHPSGANQTVPQYSMLNIMASLSGSAMAYAAVKVAVEDQASKALTNADKLLLNELDIHSLTHFLREWKTNQEVYESKLPLVIGGGKPMSWPRDPPRSKGPSLPKYMVPQNDRPEQPRPEEPALHEYTDPTMIIPPTQALKWDESTLTLLTSDKYNMIEELLTSKKSKDKFQSPVALAVQIPFVLCTDKYPRTLRWVGKEVKPKIVYTSPPPSNIGGVMQACNSGTCEQFLQERLLKFQDGIKTMGNTTIATISSVVKFNRLKYAKLKVPIKTLTTDEVRARRTMTVQRALHDADNPLQDIVSKAAVSEYPTGTTIHDALMLTGRYNETSQDDYSHTTARKWIINQQSSFPKAEVYSINKPLRAIIRPTDELSDLIMPLSYPFMEHPITRAGTIIAYPGLQTELQVRSLAAEARHTVCFDATKYDARYGFPHYLSIYLAVRHCISVDFAVPSGALRSKKNFMLWFDREVNTLHQGLHGDLMAINRLNIWFAHQVFKQTKVSSGTETYTGEIYSWTQSSGDSLTLIGNTHGSQTMNYTGEQELNLVNGLHVTNLPMGDDQVSFLYDTYFQRGRTVDAYIRKMQETYADQYGMILKVEQQCRNCEGFTFLGRLYTNEQLQSEWSVTTTADLGRRLRKIHATCLPVTPTTQVNHLLQTITLKQLSYLIGDPCSILTYCYTVPFLLYLVNHSARALTSWRSTMENRKILSQCLSQWTLEQARELLNLAPINAIKRWLEVYETKCLKCGKNEPCIHKKIKRVQRGSTHLTMLSNTQQFVGFTNTKLADSDSTPWIAYSEVSYVENPMKWPAATIDAGGEGNEHNPDLRMLNLDEVAKLVDSLPLVNYFTSY